MHLGSLYHDDVMDEAEYRRGVESVNARWGNLVAILAGDFLLARASEIAASLGTEVAGLLARTIGDLCEGEVGQLRYAFDPARPEAAYLSSIAGKTASLDGHVRPDRGLVGGAPRPWVDALTGVRAGPRDGLPDLGRRPRPGVQRGAPGQTGRARHGRRAPTPCRCCGRWRYPAWRRPPLLAGRAADHPTRDKARDLVLSTSAVAGCLLDARKWAGQADLALDVLRGDGAPSEYLR